MGEHTIEARAVGVRFPLFPYLFNLLKLNFIMALPQGNFTTKMSIVKRIYKPKKQKINSKVVSNSKK